MENDGKVQSDRNLYRVRLTLMQKELIKVFQTYLPYTYSEGFKITPDRERVLNELGMTVTRNANNIIKIGFQSKHDYLLFKLRWS